MIKNDIGINAGTIWNLLSEKGELSINEIVELTKYRESYILLALGWLARENKVQFFDKNGSLFVSLNNPFSESFY